MDIVTGSSPIRIRLTTRDCFCTSTIHFYSPPAVPHGSEQTTAEREKAFYTAEDVRWRRLVPHHSTSSSATYGRRWQLEGILWLCIERPALLET